MFSITIPIFRFVTPALVGAVMALIPIQQTSADLLQRLNELKAVCETGALTKAECDATRAKILENHADSASTTTETSEEKVAWMCNYNGDTAPPLEDVQYQFSERASASTAVREILDVAGLMPNFIVRASGVPNAAASIRGQNRFIEYNPSFVAQLQTATGTNWAVYSVLAHEIGHHLQGHTIQSGGSRPSIELEADEYSGYILARLGATEEQARAAMNKFGQPSGSSTHPGRADRLSAISRGWERGGESRGEVSSDDTDIVGICSIDTVRQKVSAGRTRSDISSECNGQVADLPGCSVRKVARLVQGGASDIDLREACEPITTPTNPSVPTQPPINAGITNVCVTPMLRCALMQSGPPGTPCWCATPFGFPSNGMLGY